MFGISDIIAVIVIEDGLKHLSANPDELNFILSPFVRHKAIRDYVGIEHITQCVEFVTQNRVYVAPYYEADMAKLPSIVTVASQGEQQQFLNDYGQNRGECVVLPPIKYADFVIEGFEDNRTVLLVPEALQIEKVLWPNITVANGSFAAHVDYIQVRSGQPTRVALKNSAAPEMIPFTGWVAQSGSRESGVEMHASIDSTIVNAQLTTTGDYSVHRLMSIVTRYCLKRGRLLFDYYGLQTAKFSQGMPILLSDQPPIYQTTFTISGQFTEHWIANRYEMGDDSGKLVLDYMAQSPGKADVELE